MCGGGGSLGRVYILPSFPLLLRTQGRLLVGTAYQPHNSVQQILVFRAVNCCGQLHLVSVEKTGNRDALYAEVFAHYHGTFT